MNTRLPQGAQVTLEQDNGKGLEKEKTPGQERADLSVDIQKKNRSFFERVYDYLKGDETREVGEQMEKGEKPKEFNWMTLTAYLAVGTVGAFGMWKMAKWAKATFGEDEKEKEEEKSKSEKSKPKFPWGWGIGLLAATGFVFRGTFFELTQKAFGFNVDKGNLEKFAEILRKKGPSGLQEAYDQLDYDTDEPSVKHFAKELSVEKRHFSELQPVAYSHFKEQRAKDKNTSYVTKAMSLFNMSVGAIPYTNADDELRRVAGETHIADYIEKHKTELGLSESELEKLTIGEIFKKFFALKAGKEKTTGTSPESKEEIPEISISQITADPSKLKTEGWDGIVKAATDLKGKDRKEVQSTLIAATLEAGGTVVDDPELGTMVINHGEGLLVSSVAIFGNDAANFPKAFVQLGDRDYGGAGESLSDSMETRWANGGLGFLVVGGAMGTAKALITKESVAWGMAKGGISGFFLGPIGVLWTSYKTLRAGEKGIWQGCAWIEELQVSIRHKGNFLSRAITRNPEKYKELIKRQLLAEGRAYLKSYDRLETAYLKHYKTGTVMTDFATIRRDALLPGQLGKMEETNFKAFASLWKTYRASLDLPSRFPIHVETYADKREELVKMINDLEEAFNPHVRKPNLHEEKTKLSDPSLESRPVAEQVDELKKAAKASDDFHKTAIEEYQEMKRSGATPDALQTKVNETKRELTQLREGFNTHLRRLTSSASNLSPTDRKLLQELIEQDLGKGMGIRAIKTEFKSRGKWSIVLGVAEAVIATNEVRESDPEAYATMKTTELMTRIGPDVLQMVFDVLSPFGLSDWASLIKGKGWLSGRELSSWDKFSCAAFGTYSLATDTLGVLGAVATSPAAGSGGAAIYGAGNAIEATLRAAGKSDDIIRIAREMLPEIASLANDVGGYKNLIKYLQKAKTVSGGVGMGITGVNVARAGWAGLQIMYDTNGQEAITGDEVDTGETDSGEGDTADAATPPTPVPSQE